MYAGVCELICGLVVCMYVCGTGLGVRVRERVHVSVREHVCVGGGGSHRSESRHEMVGNIVAQLAHIIRSNRDLNHLRRVLLN